MHQRRLKAYSAVGYAVVQPSGFYGAQADLKFAEIERTAVQAVIAFEEARGCRVDSVESDTRGFDLISRFTLATNGKSAVTRFIEVKGRGCFGKSQNIPMRSSHLKRGLEKRRTQTGRVRRQSKLHLGLPASWQTIVWYSIFVETSTGWS
jgi:Protein NO VEIN, C-terminal